MEPEIAIRLTSEQLTPFPQPERDDCGAVIDFFGVVRGSEEGRQIAGLDYEAYQPMAEREMARIIRQLLDEFPCRAVVVTHRLGFVPVGEASISIRIAAPHRQEAIACLAEFMNRLKKDVPIWKRTSQPSAPPS